MKITLLIPTFLVLYIVWNLGEIRPEHVVDGRLIVASIVVYFGLWLFGYWEGKSE